MAFAAARMILKDKRRKASKEDFRDPRNRSKVSFILQFLLLLGQLVNLVVTYNDTEV